VASAASPATKNPMTNTATVGLLDRIDSRRM
jgi:hypothetical protein